MSKQGGEMGYRKRMIKRANDIIIGMKSTQMVSFGHKHVDASLLMNFLLRIKHTHEEEPQWKTGPYMEYSKINGVTVSYWEGKGTLMLQ